METGFPCRDRGLAMMLFSHISFHVVILLLPNIFSLMAVGSVRPGLSVQVEFLQSGGELHDYCCISCQYGWLIQWLHHLHYFFCFFINVGEKN